MVTHKAYLDLPASACKELPFFLKKVKTKTYDPNRYVEEFEFPYREANALGFSTATHHRTIKALIENGLIDIVYLGGKKSGGMTSSRFRLSERRTKYGTSEFVKFPWSEFLQKTNFHVKNGNIKRPYSVKNENDNPLHFQK